MTRGAWRAVVVLALLMARGAMGAEQAASGRDALLAADRAFAAETAKVGMAKGFLTWLAEDARLMQAGTPTLFGLPAIRSYFDAAARPGEPEPRLTWEPEFAEIAASGDLGYTIGVYQLEIVDGEGRASTRPGKYLSVWRKDAAGRWRVVADIGNPNGPPGPAARPATTPVHPAPAGARNEGATAAPGERR